MADAPRRRSASPVAFRTATTADVAELATWLRTPRECELWAGPRLAFPPDPALLPADIDLYQADSVALIDATGLLAFGQLLYMDAQRAHLARIIVRPAARHRGHGRALLQELLARARRSGCLRASLYVDRDNDPAHALYARLGFTPAPRPATERVSARSLYLECRLD